MMRALIYLLIAISCHQSPALATTWQEKPQQDSPAGNVQVIQNRGEIFTTRSTPTTVPLPADDQTFQFIIYGDRTGGEPSGLKFLKQAVKDTNLLDPDFVMTVGDLIQGYNRPNEWMREMQQYKDIMAKLKMNWFPVAGNHDIYWDFRDAQRPPIHHEANFEKHFGPLWYSFKHKNNGFIVLFSDEGDRESGEKGFNEARLQNMSDEQSEFLDKALGKLGDCRQVFAFLHHPRWLGGGYEGSNWPAVHQRFVAAGNVSAVFAGHIHRMTYAGVVDGIEYFTLAATGGRLATDSPELGYLHHFNVVTVREDDFQVASIPVGNVTDPRTFKKDFLDDVEIVRGMRPQRAANRLLLDGDGGVQGDYSIRIPNPGSAPIEVTITPEISGGWQALPDHAHVIVPPNKTAGMKFQFFRPSGENSSWGNFIAPTFNMSTDYLHSEARIRLPEVSIPIDIGLDVSAAANPAENGCLELRGRQTRRSRRTLRNITNDSARLNSSDFDLPQGPFTLEAWIKPTDNSETRGIVCNTQSSGYALFLHDGRLQFDVHLDNRYVSPAMEDALPLNQWQHVAGVYDGATAKLFLDGKLVKSLPATGTRTVNDLPLYIGADPDGNGNPSREFAGSIDEVRLSKTVRYTEDFESQQRFETDDQTIVLLHMDKKYGPFLLNDANQKIPVLSFGKSSIAPRD